MEAEIEEAEVAGEGEKLLDIIFPLLDNNDLLRLRRVNKGLKEITDRYLRSHAPSKRPIKLNLFNASGASSLSQFLEEDRNSSIRMPSSVVELLYSDGTGPNWKEEGVNQGWVRQLRSPEMDSFLRKYGNQIRSLKMHQLSLPIKRNSAQFRLLERIPKLQKLHIMHLKNPEVAAGVAGDVLPNCFITTLKIFEVDFVWERKGDIMGRNRLWKLVAQLNKLEIFKPPFKFHESGGRFLYRPWGVLLENLIKLVNNKTTAIHTLDFTNCNQLFLGDYAFTPKFIDLCVRNKIKCTNISTEYLLEVEKSLVAEFTNCITSMDYYRCNYDPGDLVFSKLVKLSMGFRPFHENYPDCVLPLATIHERFSNLRFPALRVLELNGRPDGTKLDSGVLASLWKTFVNLEELFIFTSGKLGNEAFVGSDVGVPPAFLQLTKLKKLSLEIPYEHKLTDTVFSLVFRQMKLKEFYLKSEKPIKRISKSAICSLLTGSFIESIERFPFRNWSLSNTSPEEFLELARKFPNNLPV